MRRLVLVLCLAGLAWWWVRRRRTGDERVVIGFEDGSSLEPPAGSPEHDELLRLAREAHAA